MWIIGQKAAGFFAAAKRLRTSGYYVKPVGMGRQLIPQLNLGVNQQKTLRIYCLQA